MNNQQKQQVLEQIKLANNVLVAVNSNPTVDELSASIGLTLALNKLGKHATTVFSGVVPSTLEFLQPEKTIETTTDSLRDFIIALDKSKADKLRYKVEDDVVRIFITPYRTSISDSDLEFSQGDFNVDVVVALGVTKSEDLDRAVTAHGRILHDATVISLTKRDNISELGSMNWQESQASSLCEMVASLTLDMQADILDGQMSTAFLTGIIAETDRFRNEKTTPLALSLSSQLMSSGANQQLIAEKLEEPESAPLPVHQYESNEPNSDESVAEAPINHDGELTIRHEPVEVYEEPEQEEVEKIHIDENGNLGLNPEDHESSESQPNNPVRLPDDNSSETYEEVLERPSGEPSIPNHEEDSEQDSSPFGQPYQNDEQQTLRHGKKTIQPPVDFNAPLKSDKPFDLNEAIQAANAAPEPVTGPNSEDVAVDAPQTTEVNSQDTVERVYEEPAPAVPVVDETATPEVSAMPEVEAPIYEDTTNQTLADLEVAVDSTHAPHEFTAPPELAAIQDEAVVTATSADTEAPLVVEQDNTEAIIEPPKIDDPTAPPLVPPPMSAPQFFDADGNNANPFLNPHQ